MALFQSSSLIKPKNSKKKLVKSWFHCYRFLNLITAIYLQLALLYIHFSKKKKKFKVNESAVAEEWIYSLCSVLA